MKTPIIAISGYARSGKDTLGLIWIDLLRRYVIKAERFAFADQLKLSVDEFLLAETGISAWTEDEKEKEIIRPFLVCWGTDIMRRLNNNVWVEKLEASALRDGVSVITDLRFENELDWVEEKGGFSFMIFREGVGPANEKEAQHGHELRNRIKYCMTLGEIKDKKMFYDVAERLLLELIPRNTLTEWKATYPL